MDKAITDKKKKQLALDSPNDKNKKEYDLLEKSIMAYTEKQEKANKAIGENLLLLQEQKKSLTTGSEESITLANEIDQLTNTYAHFIETNSQDQNPMASALQNIENGISSYSNSLKSLNQVESLLANDSSLSYDEKEKFLTLYPQLENAIYRTADGWGIESGALQTLKETMKNTQLAQVESEKARTLSALNGTTSRLGFMLTEATTFSEFSKLMLKNKVPGAIPLPNGQVYIGRGTEAEELTNRFNEYTDFEKKIKKAQQEIEDLAKNTLPPVSNIKKPTGYRPAVDKKKDEKDKLADLEHQIFLNSKIPGTEQKQILLYKQMQAQVHSLANAGKARGLKDNDDYIQELQKQWWSYEETIRTLSQQQLANRMAISKNYIEECNTHNNWGADNEIAAWDRVLVWLENDFYKTKLISEKEFLAEKESILHNKIALEKTALNDLLAMTKNHIKQQKEDEKASIQETVKSAESYVSVQKELLTLKKQENEYNQSASKQQRDKVKIEEELFKIANDNSASARAKRLKLQEELYYKNQEISQTQMDRETILVEQQMDKDLEIFKKEKDAQIKTIDDYLKNVSFLTADAIGLINTQSDTLYQGLILWNQQYGDGMDQTVISKWNLATEALNNYKDQLGNFDFNNALYQTGGQSFDNREEKIAQMKRNSNAWAQADATERVRLQAENIRLGKELAAYFNPKDSQWYADSAFQTPLYYETLSTKNQAFSNFILGEGVNTPQQMNALMKKTLPQITFAIPNLQSNYGVNTGVGDINFEILVQGNMDQSVIPQLKQLKTDIVADIVSTFDNRGQRRSVKQFAL